MNNKFTELCNVLEQTVAQLEPGTEFVNLQKVFMSLDNACGKKCDSSQDPLCAHQCKVRSAAQAISQGSTMMSKLNSERDAKQRERQQLKLKRQIERMKQRYLEYTNRLRQEKSKQARLQGNRPA